VNTAGVRRPDGSYVVERRGADSAGNRKVFESFDALRRRCERLPETFTAEDLSATGLTAGRRHMVLWHLVEHPAFPVALASRQPLTAEKTTTMPAADGDATAEAGGEKTATEVAEP